MTKTRGAKAGTKRLEQKGFWPGWLGRLAANHNQVPSWRGSWKVAFSHSRTAR